MLKNITALSMSGAIALGAVFTPATAADAHFGPKNPLYAPSTLPFHLNNALGWASVGL
jgi:hypothetical protein